MARLWFLAGFTRGIQRTLTLYGNVEIHQVDLAHMSMQEAHLVTLETGYRSKEMGQAYTSLVEDRATKDTRRKSKTIW